MINLYTQSIKINKALILTLMMLSFISRDGRSQKALTQNKTKKLNKEKKSIFKEIGRESLLKVTSILVGIAIGVVIYFVYRKTDTSQTQEQLQEISKTDKVIQSNSEQSQQEQERQEREEKEIQQQAQQQLRQLQQKLEERERQEQKLQQLKNIREEFKNKTCESILEKLGVSRTGTFMPQIKLKSLEDLLEMAGKSERVENVKNMEEYMLKYDSETTDAIIEVFRTNHTHSLFDTIYRHINNNMTEVTLNKLGEITFSNPSDESQQSTVSELKNNEGYLIDTTESKNIQNLINAIVELRKMLSEINTHYANDPRKNDLNLTFKEIKDLNIDYKDIFKKTPTEANIYMVELRGQALKAKE